MAGCREFQRVADRRGLEELRARHHHLKRYLPKFLQLPFQGGPGTELLLEAITYARRLHAGEHAGLGADAPTGFAAGIWCQAVKTSEGNAPDLRSWELALAFAIRDALRSGDLYLAESRHHVSFWNLVQSSEQWAERRASAYIELSLATEPEHVLDRLRTERFCKELCVNGSSNWFLFSVVVISGVSRSELKRAGGRAASRQLAPPCGRMW